MKYSIVYSSKTGNTTLLAKKLEKILPTEDCIYYGGPDEKALEGDIIFIGSGIYKGLFDEELSTFLEKIYNKKVFLFGTTGFGKSEMYFETVFSRIKSCIDSSNTVVGSYMCQGKMPLTVRARYESMLDKEPEKMKELIENFDEALSHPNDKDLDFLEQAVAEFII